jgi:hypothetical protein
MLRPKAGKNGQDWFGGYPIILNRNRCPGYKGVFKYAAMRAFKVCPTRIETINKA